MSTFAFALIDDFCTSRKFARSSSKGCSPSRGGKGIGEEREIQHAFYPTHLLLFSNISVYYATQKYEMR